MRTAVVVIASCFLAASSAFAQSTYVGAAVAADVTRFSHAERTGLSDEAGSGEALSWALRAGTPIGAAWGVDLEFSRAAELERDTAADIIIQRLAQPGSRAAALALAVPDTLTYRVRSRSRTTTLNATAWAQQTLTARVALVYLGGLGFHRIDRNTDIGGFTPLAATREALALIYPPPAYRIVSYGVGPVAGFDVRLGLNDHVQIVPGVRLQGLDSGWLLRPSVGIGWAW